MSADSRDWPSVFAASAWLAAAEGTAEDAAANGTSGQPGDVGADGGGTMLSTSFQRDGLRMHLAWNMAVFVFGVVVWACMTWAGDVLPGRWAPRRTPTRRGIESNSCYCNYICYLRIMRNLFLSLTIVEGLVMAFARREELLTAGIWRGWLSICQEEPKMMPAEMVQKSLAERQQPVLTYEVVVLIFLSVLINGSITLFFAKLFQSCLTAATPNDIDAPWLDRTLWLQWLPTEDRRRRKRFELSDDDFDQVASDLKCAFEEALRNQEPAYSKRRLTISHNTLSSMEGGTRAGPILRVEVAPVVDDISAVSFQLRDAREKRVAYKELLKHCRPYMRWWYTRRLREQERLSVKHKGRFLELLLSRKRLSGSAFVTFRSSMERKRVMMLDETQCVGYLLQRLTGFFYFTFGRPPFSSVTLRCELAPHPDEIIWQNLHIGFIERQIRFWSLATLLLVGLTLGITPAVTDVFANAAALPVVGDMWHGWDALLHRLQAVVLLVINSLVLPQCLYVVAVVERTFRKSIIEARQLTLNFFFLVLNVAGLPLLDKEAIVKTWEYCRSLTKGAHSGAVLHDVLEEMSYAYISGRGSLCVQYLMSAAFLSGCVALLASLWMPLVSKALSVFVAVTPRERREAMEPWPFAWGYFYAWTLSLFAMALFMSPLVPGTLPISAIFFATRARIDQRNLSQGVYSCGSEDSGNLAMTVISYLLHVVAVWWLFVGCVFLGDPFPKIAPRLSVVAGVVFFTGGTAILMVTYLEQAKFRWWNKVMRRLSVEGGAFGHAGLVVSRMATALGVSPGRTTIFASSTKTETCQWNVMRQKDIVWPDKDVSKLVALARSEPRFADMVNDQLARGGLNIRMQGGSQTSSCADLEEVAKSFMTQQASFAASSSQSFDETSEDGDECPSWEVEMCCASRPHVDQEDEPYRGEYDGTFKGGASTAGEEAEAEEKEELDPEQAPTAEPDDPVIETPAATTTSEQLEEPSAVRGTTRQPDSIP